ncbi:3-hydroxyacyl-CoA dehydrogenase NAD-binding domain-containing protein [Roseovarius sp. D22-M7]|uniref:3-hydroxyacyl-CoA dehydrogenase NAD-binding domain-containing protein n=1 Tax=Roseovarius sp. D22-M7 TaxID=3127116 RepID=UPI003010126D
MTNTPVLNHLSGTGLELGPARDAMQDGPWRCATDDDGITWLILDLPDSGANTISNAVIEGLRNHLSALEKDTPGAVVIRSSKTAGFAAGADISEIEDLLEHGKVPEALRAGHHVLDRLEALPCPTIAVVHGAALGAGFELALACDYRLAVDGASFGFPEVQLGLHPGLGGTFRLTRLIDPTEAMRLMLTGKSAHTGKAKRLGIADAVVEERHVRGAAGAAVRGELEQAGSGLKARALSLRPARLYSAREMRAKTAEKARQDHYPAPYRLIDLWERHGGDSAAMQTAEIESFAELLKTDTATNLRRVFFLRQTLKQAARGAHDIARLHVVGAGMMGADIAAWTAVRGLSVTLEDIDTAALGAAVSRTVEIAKEAHLSDRQVRDAVDRMMPDPKGYGAAKADLVIEAVPEDGGLKAKIYHGLEERMKTDAILATNTSSLSVVGLAGQVARPERFAGLHFFNPVARMQLVEVVGQPRTDTHVLDRLAAFCGSLDKLPARVSDYPGFLVNRALTPYLLEAMSLIDEGVSPASIDKAAEEFGFPMGPVELADRVGLDICLAVGNSLGAGVEKPLAEISDRLKDLVKQGNTGQKAGKGLYTWSDSKPDKRVSDADPPDDLEDRLILPLLDSCVECLRREVVADERTLDAAMIFATGFAPFRGGPMHYARTRGPAEIHDRLVEMARRHGPRFEPDKGWSDL